MGRHLGPAGRVYVADEDGIVHHFDPGDEVPKWAAKQITNPKAWGDSADSDAASTVGGAGDGDTSPAPANGDGDSADATTKPYSKWKKDDLQAEVARRNEGRDDDDLIVVEGKGNVPDLAAALEGDDVAQADTGDQG